MRIRSQTVCDSRDSEETQKVNKGERDQNLAFNLVILMRIPPIFLSKSRVLRLVYAYGGIFKKGGPHSSHVLLF